MSVNRWTVTDFAPQDTAGLDDFIAAFRDSPSLRARRPWLAFKETLDWVVAASALLLLLPVLFIVAVAVRLSSPGPVLSRHQRIGKDGQLFEVLKFRTVAVESKAKFQNVPQSGDAVVQFQLFGDPRVTSIGSILRRSAVDELPQLLNVLRGEMSLVGPHPLLPRELPLLQGYELRLLRFRPGLVGPALLIPTDSRLTWDAVVQLELEYVDEWSLLLDARILAATVSAAFGGTVL